jgi:hypothetical protein
MCSEEALGMFLWTLGSPQSVSQVHKRFKRSKETINRKFAEVLYCVNQLAGDIIKPNLLIHSSQLCTRDYGTLDSHLILMVQLVLSMGHTYRLLCQLLLWSTMLAALDIPHRMLWLCDFDLRFTSIVARWPCSMHDTRIFKDTLLNFPHPPPSIC